MTMKLANLQPGKKAKVTKIDGGIGAKNKLQAMGIFAGVKVVVIQSLHKGPVIIESGNTRIAIGRGLAEKVEVEANE